VSARLVLHTLRYELTTFSRDTQSWFFTLALPVLLLVILVGILGTHRTQGVTGIATLETYYVPAMMTFGVVWASLVNLTVTVTSERERGVLKRRRATPVPAPALIAARALTAALLSLLVALLVLVVGRVAYGVEVGLEKLPALLLVALVGSLSFCCLGYALVSFIGSEEAAIPVTQAIALPLFFISGVLIEYAGIPDTMRSIAEVLPVQPLADAGLLAFDSREQGAAIAGGDLAVVAAWGLLGLTIALWRFSWEPHTR
jgi:ABC-2 type transport system permease protein